jgi:tRNA threonylcarbamoyladenosine biosynthesis protein TsaB
MGAAKLPACERPIAVLAIETAGSNCSVAVLCDRTALAVERRPLRHGHAELVLPMVERVMAGAGLAPSQLDAVAVAVGPGGFTGIRVGLAAAHGIALALGTRLVGVSSFAAVAAALPATGDDDRRIVLVALDSRRTELYVQLFAPDLATPLAAPAALHPDHLAAHLAGHLADIVGGAPLLVAGDAAEAAAGALGGDFAIANHSAPDALGVAAAARRQLRAATSHGPVQPLYLRPPDVTLPKRREPIAAGPR